MVSSRGEEPGCGTKSMAESVETESRRDEGRRLGEFSAAGWAKTSRRRPPVHAPPERGQQQLIVVRARNNSDEEVLTCRTQDDLPSFIDALALLAPESAAPRLLTALKHVLHYEIYEAA